MATLIQRTPFNARLLSTKYKCLPPAPARISRKIWTARTIVSNEPEQLLQAIPSNESAVKSNIAIFNISRNIPSSTLSALVKRFQDLPVPTIGCLSLGNDGQNGPYLLSYSLHESPNNYLEMAVPFRSTIQGTPKIAVGREVARMGKRLESTEWAGDESVIPDQLPEELRMLDPKHISEIVYFTDEQPQGLMKTLDAHLPDAVKVGLIASPTPFATGRPHTLLSGQDIFSDGAVGFAICRYPKREDPSAILTVDYGKLEVLGEPLEVTSCKGNIILELGSENATRLLLERIKENVASPITKDLGFYLGLLPNDKPNATLDQMLSVRPINAGDPSRGALSLDTEANIRAGQRVQFLHAPGGATQPARLGPSQPGISQRDPTSPDTDRTVMVFRSDLDPDALQRLDGETSSSDNFFAASEHGFIVGRPREASWICQVNGSQGELLL